MELPTQPAGTPWPEKDWPTGELPPAITPLIDAAFDDAGPLSTTQAVVMIQGGRLLVERYAGALEFFDRPPEPIGPNTRMLSWSMAKSMLHAVVGMLIAEGRLHLDTAVDVAEWDTSARREITLDLLLAMRDGLDYVEDYVDDRKSDVIEMLFGSGKSDCAHFAANRPLRAAPDTRFNYSSGSSNIVSGIVARLVGPGEPYETFVFDRLFRPLGIKSARLTFDEAGTWIASSYARLTARDFARFGLLYLRGGTWNGVQVVPRSWVETARVARSVDAIDGQLHSMHWWVSDDGFETFACQGYEGQSISLCPAADVVLVRLGKTPAEHSQDLRLWRNEVMGAFVTHLNPHAPS